MKSSTGKDETISTAGIITNFGCSNPSAATLRAGSLEDISGTIEMLIFPEAYRRWQKK